MFILELLFHRQAWLTNIQLIHHISTFQCGFGVYPFQSAFTPITPKELSVSDTTFKVLVLSEGIEPSFHSYQECVLTILLREQFWGLWEFRNPDPLPNKQPLCLWANNPILPHFTGLTDRLPYGSGGFLLFQDSVVMVGIEPTARKSSTYCSTNWATSPAPVYLCKGGGSTDTIIPLFCCPGRTRTSIKWLTVTRNNLYTTRQFLTTTWLLSSLWNSYHSFLVVICGSPGNRTLPFRFSV